MLKRINFKYSQKTLMNPALESDQLLTQRLRSIGINNWHSLLEYVRKLPYGRNNNRTDFSLVITEGKGSCSSKHGLIKMVARENGLNHVQLMLGIYSMNALNTPGIKNALSESGLKSIPEAHCYLKIDGERVDLTSFTSDFSKIENDLIEEVEIIPQQISEFKVKYHQKFMKKWLIQNKTNLTFEEAWIIRERCIANLSS